MKSARIGEDVRREHRDPADHSEGRSESCLFVLNRVTPPAHCSQAVAKCVILFGCTCETNMQLSFAHVQARAFPLTAAHSHVYIKMQRKP